MMDTDADTPQGVDPIQSTTFVVSKRLRCSTTSTDPVYKALDADNTSFSQGRLHPLDNEILLEEILLRLPPKPSSLPQASLVCTLWRSILSDPRFLKRFRKHHQKPPLLGFFVGYTGSKHNFVPVMDTKPDRISAARFCVPKSSRDFLGCRHGLAVFIKWLRETVVWDPLTGQQQRVPFPPGLGNAETDTFWDWHAAVLCVDPEDGHVHGDCFSSPFKLVLTCGGDTQASACLYESKSGAWGNIASTPTTDEILPIRPSVLIRNALFWLLCEGDILAFDIESQSLDVIEKPVDAQPVDAHGAADYSFQLLRTNDSGLGFASMSDLGIQLWKRSSNSDNVVGWVLQSRVIQLDGLFPQGMPSDHKMAGMVGYDEESNAIVLATYIGDFMLQLDSMQFIRISKRNCWSSKLYYPYRNFYTAGRGVGWKWMDQKL